MLVKKIKELQFLSAVLLFLQLIFYKWWILFHLLAVILSVIVICNAKLFRCVDARYNYWMIGLFLYRICIYQWCAEFQLFILIYTLLAIYIVVVMILCTYRSLR